MTFYDKNPMCLLCSSRLERTDERVQLSCEHILHKACWERAKCCGCGKKVVATRAFTDSTPPYHPAPVPRNTTPNCPYCFEEITPEGGGYTMDNCKHKCHIKCWELMYKKLKEELTGNYVDNLCVICEGHITYMRKYLESRPRHEHTDPNALLPQKLPIDVQQEYDYAQWLPSEPVENHRGLAMPDGAANPPPTETCTLCQKTLFLFAPDSTGRNVQKVVIVRLVCGHLFHRGCFMHYNYETHKDTCPTCDTRVDRVVIYTPYTAPEIPTKVYEFPDLMPDIRKGVCQYCHTYIEKSTPPTLLEPCGHLFHEECLEASRQICNNLYAQKCIACHAPIEYALVCPYPYPVYNAA